MISLKEYDRIHDGCIQAKYKHKQTGEIIAQRKRRPANATPDVCTWHASVYCQDHPNRNDSAIPRPVCGYKGEPVCSPPDCSGACPVGMPDTRPDFRHTQRLEMLSKDWKGWVDPLNRCVGNLVEILRADGRSDTAIHNIVELIYFKERDEA